MPTGRAADGSMLHAPTDEERTCYEKLEKLLIFPPGVLGAGFGAVFGVLPFAVSRDASDLCVCRPVSTASESRL